MSNQTKAAPVDRMTMTVREYARAVGVGEAVVRAEIAANRLPHRKYGKRRLIRIFRRPALQEFGLAGKDSA